MVSENNRYSKYLDEEDVEVEIVEDSYLRNMDQVAEGDKGPSAVKLQKTT